MAFPVDYTLLGDLEFPVVAGSHSGFVALVKHADLTSTMLAAANDTGGNLRFSSDDAGSSPLPCEIVQFNKVTAQVQIWVRNTSVTTGTKIYLWAGASGVSQPSATEALGSQAVWSDYEFVFHGDTPDDSAGNVTPVIDGAVSSSGKIGDGYELTAANQQKIYIPLPNALTNNITLSAWTKLNTLAGNQTIIGLAEEILPDNQDRLLSDNGRLSIGNFGGTGLAAAAPSTGFTTGQWFSCCVAYTLEDPSKQASAYLNGELEVSNNGISGSGISNFRAFNRVALGTTADSTDTWWLDGGIDEARGTLLALSATYIKLEYENQSSSGPYFIATDAPTGPNTPINPSITNLLATSARLNWGQG